MQYAIVFNERPEAVAGTQEFSVSQDADNAIATLLDKFPQIETLSEGAHGIPLHNGLLALCQLVLVLTEARFPYRVAMVESEPVWIESKHQKPVAVSS